MLFKKLVPEGGAVPQGYGVAWRYNRHMTVTCYPVPLNLIVRVYHTAMGWLKFKLWPSKYETDLIKAHTEGYKEMRENYENRLVLLKGMEKIREKL